jgi:intron-binding protein aquarius
MPQPEVPSAYDVESEDLIREIYRAGFCHDKDAVGCLEYVGYLEKVLWVKLSCCGSSVSHALALSIIALFNESARRGRLRDTLARLLCFEPAEKHKSSPFCCLLNATCVLAMDQNCSLWDLESILQFLVHVYTRLEHAPVRRAALRLTSLALWDQLSECRRTRELRAFPQLQRHWQHHLSKKSKHAFLVEASFFPSLMGTVRNLAEATTNKTNTSEWPTRCVTRFMELSTDLLLQLPTRRFLHAVLDDARIIEQIGLSVQAEDDRAAPLLGAFRTAIKFSITNQTGQVPRHGEEIAERYARIYSFQCACYLAQPEDAFCRDIAFASTAQLAEEDALRATLSRASVRTLVEISCDALHILPRDLALQRPELIIEAAASEFCSRPDVLESVNSGSLYPSEATLLNEVPHQTDWPLALPKLNLQFLTFQDYLIRCFTLYRLESAHEVRADVGEAIRRLKPRNNNGGTSFTGWSRFATECTCSVMQTTKPTLKKAYSARAFCNITIDLANFGNRGVPLREEWEQLRKRDIIFLLSVNAAPSKRAPTYRLQDVANDDDSLALQSVYAVRGGEIIDVRNEADLSSHVVKDDSLSGTRRTIVIQLDPEQYHIDGQSRVNTPYRMMNILLRRDARANNFRQVLETIRDLISAESIDSAVPAWLRDIILGYGNADAAHYSRRNDQLDAFDAVDTFHDLEHVVRSFPEMSVTMSTIDSTFRPTMLPERGRLLVQLSLDRAQRSVTVNSQPLTFIDGQHSTAIVATKAQISEMLRSNPVRFTPLQVEAIRDGMNPGLTLVVGPPGTGKTDVAVQVVANLHRNFPAEKTLLVAHSNAALNDLFEKILERNVPARHLVRLGAGERDLSVETSFSQVGRVDAMLARRLTLLDEVQRLSSSLWSDRETHFAGDRETSGYTCESADYFERTDIDVRIGTFKRTVQELGTTGTIKTIQAAFPFTKFFGKSIGNDQSADVMSITTIFGTCRTYQEAGAMASTCIEHIQKIFTELREYRALELLRSQKQRMDYLLTKQARVVAMTCTHAALVRKDLVHLGFFYDTVVVEEAAQMLEIETFIPLLLQPCCNNKSLLKRVILIGDHRQLPPVVQNSVLARKAMFDQSLFARLIRLGTPTIHLDRQGRSRPEIARLYNWRYNGLGNLDIVLRVSYAFANPGFGFVYQFIDVPDFQGCGEYCPTPHFFQNLGEAEYIVAVYMYMRLFGYPASCITILTTYNGQKALLRDILIRRCADDLRYGLPHVIDTVDKYQGSQNHYILLSLVRTKAVGHLRDVRRLVVAMSRARLGLYVFGCIPTFRACNDLQPTMATFLENPSKLTIAFGDNFYGQTGRKLQIPCKSMHIPGPAEMSIFIKQLAYCSVVL